MLDRNVKPTKESIERREAWLVSAENELAELYELQKMKDSAWWKIRCDRLRKKLDTIEARLDTFETMEPRAIELHLAERLMLRTELKTDGEIEAGIERLESSIALARQEIGERRERLGIPATA